MGAARKERLGIASGFLAMTRTLGQTTGVAVIGTIFAAQAAAYAGLVKAVERGLVDADERVVVLSTGSGLKDVASAMKAVGEPLVVSPDLADVRRAMSG